MPSRSVDGKRELSQIFEGFSRARMIKWNIQVPLERALVPRPLRRPVDSLP
jgi:hypothetical protein